jgi:hypothetical protein
MVTVSGSSTQNFPCAFAAVEDVDAAELEAAALLELLLPQPAIVPAARTAAKAALTTRFVPFLMT